MLRIPVCVALLLLASCSSFKTPDHPKAEIYPANEAVNFAGCQFEVVEVSRQKEVKKHFQRDVASHGFLVVKVKWTNLLNVPREITYNPVFTAYQGKREFAASPTASVLLTMDEGAISAGAVNPGAARMSVAAFDMPPGHTFIRVIAPNRSSVGLFGSSVEGPYFYFDLGEVLASEVN